MKPSSKLSTWRTFQAANEYEINRINYLRSAPLPQNPPEVMRPTKVRVLKASFCIKGQPVQVDSILTMPFHEAQSLQTLGKVIILIE